jgi:hypothetical protein
MNDFVAAIGEFIAQRLPDDWIVKHYVIGGDFNQWSMYVLVPDHCSDRSYYWRTPVMIDKKSIDTIHIAEVTYNDGQLHCNELGTSGLFTQEFSVPLADPTALDQLAAFLTHLTKTDLPWDENGVVA